MASQHHKRPPAWLGEGAKSFWVRIVPTIDDFNSLFDPPLMTALCTTLADLKRIAEAQQTDLDPSQRRVLKKLATAHRRIATDLAKDFSLDPKKILEMTQQRG